MATKTKKKECPSINSSQFEKLCINNACLRLDNVSLLDKAKTLLVGENPIPSEQGKGPFAYKGLKSSNRAIFVGYSAMDANKGIVNFSGPGIPNLETQLVQKTSLISEARCQRFEAISYLNLPSCLKQLQTLETRQNYLRDLSSKLLIAGPKKVKGNFDERKKKLEIGSKGARLLSLAWKEVFNTSGVKEQMLVVELVCVDSQASNVFEATKSSTNSSLQCSAARQVMDLLDLLPVKEEVLTKVEKLISNYNTGSVLISKRERTQVLEMHSKVKDFKSGLNSCLNNLAVLDPQAQQQYLDVMIDFISNLKRSSLTEKTSLTMIEIMNKALALDPVSAEAFKNPKKG